MLELILEIEGGDSGAWVLDNATGSVCGHVLAYSSASGIAYIAPMEVLLDDMAATLSATITLPDPSLKIPERSHFVTEPLLRDFSLPLLDSPTRDKRMSTSISSTTDLGRISPPLPTSPPALVHQLSGLSLAETSAKNRSKSPLVAYHGTFEEATKCLPDNTSLKRHSGGSETGSRATGAVAGPSNIRGAIPRGARLIKT